MRDVIDKISIINEGWKEDLDKLASDAAQDPSLKNLQKYEKDATGVEGSWYEILPDPMLIGNFYALVAKKLKLPMMFHADGSGRASLTTQSQDNKNVYQVVADGSREKTAEQVAKKQNEMGGLNPKLVKKFKLDSKDSTPQDPTGKVDPGLAKHVKPKTTDDYAKAAGLEKPGPKQSIKSGLKLGNVQKMTADDRNIKDLMTAYNNILKKYGSSLSESVLKEEDPDLSRTRNMMKGGTLDTPKSPKNVEADLAMLQAISDAVQRGFDAGTLSSTQKTNSLIMKMLNDTDRYTAMVKKDSNYQDVAYDPTDEYKGLSPTPEPETAVAQVDPRLQGKDSGIKGDTQVARTDDDDTELQRLARLSGATSKTEPKGGIAVDLKNPRSDKRASRASDARNVMSKPVGIIKNTPADSPPEKEKTPAQTGFKQEAGNYAKRFASDPNKFILYVNGARKGVINADQIPKGYRIVEPKGRSTPSSRQQGNNVTLGRTEVRPNPKTSGGYGQFADSVTYNIFGKKIMNELDQIKNLAGLDLYQPVGKSNVLTEATLNVSLTGNNGAEVAELWQILKGAGMNVADRPPMEEPHMCPACAAVHSMDTPCGEAVEEEWDNSPEEEYQDDEYMLHDLSGGLNRKKDRQALRVKDPAVAYESKLKNSLRGQLKEMYKKLAENDPFAELDRATASDDMEGDLERQEKEMRKKFPKRNRTKADAAFDELGQYMKKNIKNEANPNADAAFAELGAEMDRSERETAQKENEAIKNLLFQAYPKAKGLPAEKLNGLLKRVKEIAANNGQTVKGMLQTTINNKTQQAPQQQAPQQQAPGIKGDTQQSRPGSSYSKEITPQGSTEKSTANTAQMSPQDQAIFQQMMQQEIAKVKLKNGRWTYPGAKVTWNRMMKSVADAHARGVAAQKFAKRQK